MIRSLRALTWVELKLFAREPLTVVFMLVLPLVTLYILNGVFGGSPDPTVWEGVSPVDFYTPAYVALVAATIGVLMLPVHLAGYRERGVLRRFKASALPPTALAGAHVAVAFITASVSAVLLVLLSRAAYDATLPVDWLGVIAAFAIVTLAFAAVGALLGALMPTARTAQGLGVLLFFVFMMLGGSGPPPAVLPDALQTIGSAIPLTHASRLLRQVWQGDGWNIGALAVIVSLLVVAAGLAAWRARTEG